MTTPPAQPDPSPHPSVSPLAGMGLDVEVLHEAMRHGLNEANKTSGTAPAIYKAFRLWAESVSHLRTLLAPRGFTRRDHKNFATVRSPDGRFEIAIVSGTYGTGLPGEHPRNRNPKGTVGQEAVHANQASFSDIDEEFPRRPDTWFLLHYEDGDKREVRLELSKPTGLYKGYVTAWARRIHLPPLPVADDIEMPADEVEDVVVDVTRRAL